MSVPANKLDLVLDKIEGARRRADSAVAQDPKVAAIDREIARLQRERSDAATQARAQGTGVLLEVTTTDQTGRRISSFIGDAEACWGPFKLPSRRVKAFNVPAQTGYSIKLTG